MSQELVLHLGVHRTGTTSLQAGLDAADEYLASKGIVALTPPRIGKRGAITIRKLVGILTSTKRASSRWLYWYYRRKARAKLASLLIEQTGHPEYPERLILSDEKMLGRAFGKNGEAVYPFARAHFASIARLLPVSPTEVHLTLRSYESFLTSVYAMRAIYAKGVGEFDLIRNEFVKTNRRWPDLIRDIQLTFPNARIVLSEFEKCDVTNRLISLIGDRRHDVGYRISIPERLNQSPTLEAIKFARANEQSSLDADTIVSKFSNGTKFDPFSLGEKKLLQQKYQEDILKLRKIRGIEWV